MSMTIARYRFGAYVLDLPKHELRHHGVATALPARVFECLCCLIEHRDRAVSRDELVQAVFGRPNVSDAQLAQVVLRSRRAIGDDGQEQKSIRTVPRFGFRWLPPVTVETDEAAVAEPRSDEPHSGEPRPDAQPAPAGSPAAHPGATAQAMQPAPPAAIDAAAPARPPPASPAARATAAVPRRWRLSRRSSWIAAACACLGLAAAGWLQRGADEAQAPAAAADAVAPRAIMVLPAELRDPGDASWARLGLMDFIGDRLQRSGLPVLPSETTLGVLHQQPDADPHQLRRSMRANWIVSSHAVRVGDDWEVRLQASDASSAGHKAQARDADLLQAARLASGRLAATLGGHAVAGDDDPPALAERLQRARAAMLANQIESARAILLAAPELQRAQPRLRYQLARVDFRAGQYQRGLATLDALLAGDDARDDPRFRVQLLNARGAMLIRLDRADEARRSYDEAIAVVGKTAQPAELGIALSGRAVANALQQRFERALADFGQARMQLASAGDTLAVARVDANLGVLEVDRGHPAQALPYLDRAARDFEAMGAINELSTFRNMRVVALLQLLRHDEAMAESERAWALLPKLRASSQRADVVLTRAHALIEAGRLGEAGRLLVMPEAGQSQPGEHGRRELLQVELALGGGAPARAVALADAALRAWPAQGDPRRRAWLRLRREQAALAADLPVSAAADAALGETLPDLLVHAVARRARGDVAAADAGYRAALALAEQRGIPAEVATVVVAHAGWLLERGRSDEASALVGRAAPWAGEDFALAALQARLLRSLGQGPQAQAAQARAAALAGERAAPAAAETATQSAPAP
ncbi:winged helix-turn-helix domain-containing protein [Luteimonas mephitis]|uniref:winged helix-turn-helix domain-containing protein n=1 Tax=Luteimonas mephitis TaxID=83615 RepID=UPI003A928BE4